MNCKQGDLAIIVAAVDPRNLGKIVRCVELRPAAVLKYPEGNRVMANVWLYEGSLPAWDGTISRHIPDTYLRPIRDPGDEARDQTLEWLPVPQINKTKETT